MVPKGSAGLSVANQIYDKFASAGQSLNKDDIAILDAADSHYYQVRVVRKYHDIALTVNPPPAWMVSSNSHVLELPQQQAFRTLVGAGLKDKTETRRPLQSLIPPHIQHISENVATFDPKSDSVTTTTGRDVKYDYLVVAAGIGINWDAVKGLSSALANPTSGVSSIYSYSTCDKAWQDIEGLRAGNAVFTQPAGVIKCAGGALCVH